MELLAYNLLHLLREFYMESEEVKRSVEWLIRRIVKVASRVSYHSRYWWVHVASVFPLRHHYQAYWAMADVMVLDSFGLIRTRLMDYYVHKLGRRNIFQRTWREIAFW